ncbi:MAG: hypothetical protein R3C44_17735 [Chloroflexota bacterium]
MSKTPSPGIGRLAERSLHAALKEYLMQPGDQIEAALDGYVIDIFRDGLLIEIQTRHLYAMRRKLTVLLDRYPVALIHPIAAEKWIQRVDANDRPLKRRKSPKQGRVLDVFRELVRVPDLLAHPNFSLEVLLIREEEVWRDDGQGSWRRKGWSLADRRLLGVVTEHTFLEPADYLALLPPDLAQPFTNRELATAAGCSSNLAQKITYTLRGLDLLEVTGKRGRAMEFTTA